MPLIVFVSFDGLHLTHLAEGRKGVAAGTGLTRLNLQNLEALHFPVSIDTCIERLNGRTKHHVEKRLRDGGLLPPESFQAFLEVFAQLSPESATRLYRYSQSRSDQVAALPEKSKQNLAQQKEGVGLALRIGGFDTRIMHSWSVPEDLERLSYLDGLQSIRVREDAMVFHDLDSVPGFNLVKRHQSGSRVFEREATRLTVTLANKLPLEEQFGCDLIYFNQSFGAFVMVQYKAMESNQGRPAEYRLPDPQLEKEISRMTQTRTALKTKSDDLAVTSFRLNADPFFMKLCRRHVFNPDEAGLFPGYYFPIDYWSRLVSDERTLGPKGGRVVTTENFGRALSDDGFIALVGGGWIGSLPTQSAVLADLIARILENGKALTFAVEQTGKAGLASSQEESANQH